jgi:hypothetical protein
MAHVGVRQTQATSMSRPCPPDHVGICHFTLLHVGPPCELHELNRPLFTTMRIDRYDYKNPIIIAISSTCSQACSLPRPRASQRCTNFEADMIVMSPSKLNFTLLVYIRVLVCREEAHPLPRVLTVLSYNVHGNWALREHHQEPMLATLQAFF